MDGNDNGTRSMPPLPRLTGGVSKQRKRKWTDELDALLLRETKLHKPHSKRYGDRGAAYTAIAADLNACGRLPWETDRKHVQGRLQHLAVMRRAHQRTSARATGVEEEHGELEVLLDDFIGESDEFIASEADRRETARVREGSLAEGGRQARDMAMRRQAAPANSELQIEGEASGDDDTEEGPEEIEVPTTPIQRERGSSTPGSGASSSFAIDGGLEGEVLRLMQANTSSFSSESKMKTTMESRRLSFDIERDNRKRQLEQARVELEMRRTKTEEDREARLQRKEEREAKLEELRIEAQQAQTTMLMKLAEMIQRKES
jgi:hypothetical protein